MQHNKYEKRDKSMQDNKCKTMQDNKAINLQTDTNAAPGMKNDVAYKPHASLQESSSILSFNISHLRTIQFGSKEVHSSYRQCCRRNVWFEFQLNLELFQKIAPVIPGSVLKR